MIRGYFRLNSDKAKLHEQVALLIEAGASSGNILFDECGDSELRRLLDMLEKGDTLLVPGLADVCRSIGEIFNLLRNLRKREVFIRSLSEPWFDFSPANMYSKKLFEIIRQFYLLACQLDVAQEQQKTNERLRGRPKGVKWETQNKLNAAFVMYNQHTHLSVADICRSVGLNDRTFYRHLSQREPLEMARRRSKGAKP